MNIELPLYCLPELNWYRTLAQKEVLEIPNYAAFPEQISQFKKIDFAGINGKQSVIIPLVGVTKKGDYKSVKLSYQTNWHHQLFNALKTAYGKSPFFEYYDYKIEPIIKKGHTFLYDLNMELLLFTLQALKVDIAIKEVEQERFEGPKLIIDNVRYYQVFEDKNGFISNVSIIDYLFNMSWLDYHSTDLNNR